MSENTTIKHSQIEEEVKQLLSKLSNLIIPQSEFAARIGVSSSTISNWIGDVTDEQPYGKYDIKRAIVDIDNDGLAITLPYRVFDVTHIERVKQAYNADPGNRKYTLSLNSTSIKALVSMFRSMGLIERGASDEAIEKFLCVALNVDELDAEIARQKAEALVGDFIAVGTRAMELKSKGIVAKAAEKPAKTDSSDS